MNSFATKKFKFLNFTEMGADLSEKIWQIRNSSRIREFMSSPDEIPFADHANFVDTLKDRKDVAYFCVLMDEELVGSVNIHFLKEGVIEHGYYIKPELFGHGLGLEISRQLYQYLKENIGITKVQTKVLKNNIRSNRMQLSLGAQMISQDNNYFYYLLNL